MRATTPSPTSTKAAEPRDGGSFFFHTRDVTGTHSLEARGVQRSTPTAAVARALAARMSLPQNVAWSLRDDASGAYLDEEQPIGDQIETGAKVSLVPRVHLG